jgi:hypothetical protein
LINLIFEGNKNKQGSAMFYYYQNFVKFSSKKYDFCICKRLFMEIMTQIHQILTKKSKLPYLYDKFQLRAKNQEGFNFFNFHIGMKLKLIYE